MSLRRPQWIPTRVDLPGLGLAATVGVVSLGLARSLPPSPYVSEVLLAMVIGALVLNTPLRHAIGLVVPGPDREPDRYAAGLRFTGKWVLRLGIILMGLKVQTGFFGRMELAVIAGVAAATVPSAFFVAHALGGLLGVRRPLVDLLAGGTMICGASAVNAVAPIAGAHREEQGLAIAVVFLFSIAALLGFRPLAGALHLDPSLAGLWSGLAVNDLSSALAVGAQMGGSGAVMAAAAKSARILLLAPTLATLSLLRRDGAPVSIKKSVVESLPGFLLGYIGLAVVRFAGDLALGDSTLWASLVAVDGFAVDLLMLTVSAGIGLHLALRSLLASSVRAIAVGGGASLWMAGLSLTMIVLVSREAPASAAVVAGVGLALSYTIYRLGTARERQEKTLTSRFDSGLPLSLAEAKRLLDVVELKGALDDLVIRRVMAQLHPSIGELIPVRESPLPKGEGCRWVTYWEGTSGWALVAMCREPASFTPIHAHPHRLLGKAIEGVLEEIRFDEIEPGELSVTSREVLGHNDLVETDGLATLHVVRVVSASPAIDVQLRGPEIGSPGRRFATLDPLDFTHLAVGTHLAVTEEIDDRPGHGGDGARAGRTSRATSL